MKILWSSNMPGSHTGYGIQSTHLVPRLQALGHEMAVHAWYGLQGSTIYMDGIPVFPAFDNERYGVVSGPAHAKRWGADVLLSLIDCWVYPTDFQQRLGGIAWAPWAPIDSQPAQPATVRRLAQAAYPLMYSQFGMRETKAAGVECTYIPHGVATGTFKPADDRAALRRSLGWPESAFVCTIVAANKGSPSRKAFAEQLGAFARFRARHSEALLYLHTSLDQPDGVDLHAMLDALGIPPDAYIWTDPYTYVQGLPEPVMALFYAASDVLLAATCGEGFGIPIVEAQSCGVPVITTDFSAMSELTVNGIATAPAQRQWWPIDVLRQAGELSAAWMAVPSVAAIAEALETIYAWPAKKRGVQAANGRAHMQAYYDWDVIVERHWRPFLERVAADRAGLVLPERPALVAVG